MKILVATDGSKHALNAVKYAVKLVRQLSSASNSITLMSVHDDAAYRHAGSILGRDAVTKYLKEFSEKELKAARKLLDATDIKHDIEIRVGHVAQQIVERANKGKYDLIVLGAKGRGAILDALIGSVAQRVLSAATTPVLLVK